MLWAPDGPVTATVDLPAGGVLTDLVGTTQALPAGPAPLTLDDDPQYLRGAVRSIGRDASGRPAGRRARGLQHRALPAGPWQYGAYLHAAPAATVQFARALGR